MNHSGALSVDAARVGEQLRSSIDPGRLAAELGIAEMTPLDAGLRATAAWFRDQHQASMAAAS